MAETPAKATPAKTAAAVPRKVVESEPELPLSSDPDRDRSKPTRPDHGEPSKEQLEAEQQVKDFLRDPWGYTPAQHRI